MSYYYNIFFLFDNVFAVEQLYLVSVILHILNYIVYFVTVRFTDIFFPDECFEL